MRGWLSVNSVGESTYRSDVTPLKQRTYQKGKNCYQRGKTVTYGTLRQHRQPKDNGGSSTAPLVPRDSQRFVMVGDLKEKTALAALNLKITPKCQVQQVFDLYKRSMSGK